MWWIALIDTVTYVPDRSYEIAASKRRGRRVLLITGILLAAGASQRFGSDKLLRRLEDGSLVAERAARRLATRLPQVIAVVGPDQVARAQLLARAGARVCVCAEAAHGMGTSLAHGVRVSAESAAWIIALADMPYIRISTIDKVYARLRAGADLTAPFFHGRRGHPVGFSARFRGELLALTGDRGAGAILRNHYAELEAVNCDDPGILRDIDRPSDMTEYQ